jgi:FKBP-type peptidyl-prolyl cis-trans isomerase
MKRLTLLILTAALVSGIAVAQDSKPTSTNGEAADFSKLFKNDAEKYSYAIGMSQATGLRKQFKDLGFDFDAEQIVNGTKDAITGAQTIITEAQMGEILTELRKKIPEMQAAVAAKAKKQGEDFLAKNKNEPGVITTASGLQYKVLAEGSGDSPGPNDEAKVNYRGTLIDGTEFDSSYKRGQPITASLKGGVIPGWIEVLKLMKAGSKYKVFIPSNLAYGERGQRGIPPNSVLIFEMEMLSFETPPPPAPAPVAANNSGQTSAPLTSDIIKVPSAEEIKKGAKIETIKAEDLEKERAKAAAATNNSSGTK